VTNQFAAGKRAIAICDRCGRRVRLAQLREIVVKRTPTNLLVCTSCWEADHPQLQLGTFVIGDAQALRRPRPDAARTELGTGLRGIQWGWAPLGGGDTRFTPNTLAMRGAVGSFVFAED
jgi:hypothetical protein